MATDYFAHAVYGIPVEGDAFEKLQEFLEEVSFYVEAANDEDWDDMSSDDRTAARLNFLRLNRPDLYLRVIILAAAPLDADLFYTGGQDSHPGRSETDADAWVVGYGMLSFPRGEIAAEFVRKADWHTWVTCG